MSTPALELRNVCRNFGTFQAVTDLSLSVPAGCVYGFLGPNGAGKTTTLRMVVDILRPSAGSITVLGAPTALAVRNRLGYLPEEKGLYKRMKAWAVIAYFATLKGFPRRDARRRAHELLERYGLGRFADTRTDALSKGMGQKVQVLAAVAHDPELVILDEPFSGLDPVNQEVMEEIIADLKSRGRTVIFSTHVMAHAERICDRLVIIGAGRRLFDGTLAEARALRPRRVRLRTDSDPGRLAGLPAVRAVAAGDAGAWELDVEAGADPQAVLAACFDAGIRLRGFEVQEPTLHDVFVHLVGPAAREAAFR